LPSAPTISASAPTAPPAAATPGSRSILPSVEAGNGGASAPPNAAFPVTIASDFAYTPTRSAPRLALIVSVST
jgi:hypothetical protein